MRSVLFLTLAVAFSAAVVGAPAPGVMEPAPRLDRRVDGNLPPGTDIVVVRHGPCVEFVALTDKGYIVLLRAFPEGGKVFLWDDARRPVLHWKKRRVIVDPSFAFYPDADIDLFKAKVVGADRDWRLLR